jgi:hypothetical protein
MNSGVCPPGSGNMDRTFLDAPDHFFERALDGWEAGLHLPAVEIGSVVGNFET